MQGIPPVDSNSSAVEALGSSSFPPRGYCMQSIIGASLSEPHIDEFAVNFLYIYIYVSYVVP